MRKVNEVIKQLNSIKSLRIECPCCEEVSDIKKTKLFNMYKDFSPNVIKVMKKKWRDLKIDEKDALENKELIKERRKELKDIKKSMPKRIAASTEGTNFGQITEKIIPSFNNFPYNQKDCRSLFDPIDYIYFSGLSNSGKIDYITIIDVKTGSAKLNHRQKEIKNVVHNGKVYHKIIKG